MKSIKVLSFLLFGTVSLLRSAGADVKDIEQVFSVMSVADDDEKVLERYETLRDYLAHGKNDLNAPCFGSGKGETYGDKFLLIAFRNDDLKLARFLVTRGVVISGPAERRMRVPFGDRQNSVRDYLQACDDLCAASTARELDKIKDALDRGAYINAREWGSGTPLMCAITSLVMEGMDANAMLVINFLFGIEGVDVNAKKAHCANRPLHGAIVAASPGLVKILLARPEIDAKFQMITPSGEAFTMLELAQLYASAGDEDYREKMREIVKLLEDHEARRAN